MYIAVVICQRSRKRFFAICGCSVRQGRVLRRVRCGSVHPYSIRLRQGFGVTCRTGAGTRPEIDRDAPPPFRFFTTNLTIILTDLYPLGRPLHAVCPHQAVIESELPRLELEQQGFVPAGADNGAELVEIHDHAELLRAFDRQRVSDRLVQPDRLQKHQLFCKLDFTE